VTEEPIQTERLLLRLWRRSDAAAFHTIWGDPEVIWWGHTQTLQESAEGLGGAIDKCADLPAGYGWYAVMHKDQQIIGNVLLQHPRSMPDETEIGWQLIRKSQGQGFATEAASALLALGFEALDIDRIIAIIMPTNHASQRVAQRLGMQITEHIEHAEKLHEVWSMTRTQFAASTTD
jgi:RimJ/RimL family protein N-acetyltransferase